MYAADSRHARGGTPLPVLKDPPTNLAPAGDSPDDRFRGQADVMFRRAVYGRSRWLSERGDSSPSLSAVGSQPAYGCRWSRAPIEHQVTEAHTGKKLHICLHARPWGSRSSIRDHASDRRPANEGEFEHDTSPMLSFTADGWLCLPWADLHINHFRATERSSGSAF